jgi:hypothetical protein
VLIALFTPVLAPEFVKALRQWVAEPDARRVPPAGPGPDAADLAAALAAGRAERRAVNDGYDDCPD